MESNHNSEVQFFSQMENWYLRKVANFPKRLRQEKIEHLEDVLIILSLMLKSTTDFHFEKKQYAVLKWKLAQYLQSYESIDVDVVYDAMLISPYFLDENQDRITYAIEIFKKKKKDWFVSKRKQEVLSVQISPEVVAEKLSGGYVLVRLMNWLHLDQESAILDHCIARSDFYINRMARGEYEIFSLRTLTGTPVVTIVYNLNTNRIEQVRKYGDMVLDGNEGFCPALIDALAKIKRIKTPCSKYPFSLEEKEFKNIPDSDYYLLVDSRNTQLDEYAFGGEFAKEETASQKVITSDFDGIEVLGSLQHKNYYIPESSLSFVQGLRLDTLDVVSFVELSIADLELDQQKRFSYLQVCETAKSLGYDVCSIQEVCAYALQFPVEQSYSFYYFGMNLYDDDVPCYIVVGNNAEQYTFFVYGKETHMFSTQYCVEYNHKFIFKKIKKNEKDTYCTSYG